MSVKQQLTKPKEKKSTTNKSRLKQKRKEQAEIMQDCICQREMKE